MIKIKKHLEIKPLNQSKSLDAIFYIDQNNHKKEINSIFNKNWLFIKDSYKLKEKNYIDLEINNKPIIISKINNEIKAFYNVCKHRAGKLKLNSNNNFKCNYHGWTYDNSGKLIGAPEFNEADKFDKSKIYLNKIKTKSWNEFLFLNMNKNEIENDLNKIFSGISERIKPLKISPKGFYKRDEYIINCNWKVYIDNYLEGYHIPHIHPELNNMIDYKEYKIELSEFYSLQYAPITVDEGVYNSNKGMAYYYYIFPNLMLNILPDRMQINIIEPINVNKTKVIFDYYYYNVSNENKIKDIEFSDLIQKQDITVCEDIQKGLESGVYSSGRLSPKREKALYHFHNLIKNSYEKNLENIIS